MIVFLLWKNISFNKILLLSPEIDEKPKSVTRYWLNYPSSNLVLSHCAFPLISHPRLGWKKGSFKVRFLRRLRGNYCQNSNWEFPTGTLPECAFNFPNIWCPCLMFKKKTSLKRNSWKSIIINIANKKSWFFPFTFKRKYKPFPI